MIHHQEIQYMLYGNQRRMGEKDQRGYKKKKTEKFSNFRKDVSTILRRPISSKWEKIEKTHVLNSPKLNTLIDIWCLKNITQLYTTHKKLTLDLRDKDRKTEWMKVV